MKNVKIYAVMIKNPWYCDSVTSEMITRATCKTSALASAKQYIKAWGLVDEKITGIREMTQAEYNERMNNSKEYYSGTWQNYINFFTGEGYIPA